MIWFTFVTIVRMRDEAFLAYCSKAISSDFDVYQPLSNSIVVTYILLVILLVATKLSEII